MKKAFNNLFHKGQATPTKILCLSAGLAIGLSLLAEVLFERSYDSFLPEAENIYRVEERYKMKDADWDESSLTSGAIAPGLKAYCPQVKVSTRFTDFSDLTLVTEDKRQLSGTAFFCDSTFFEVFPRKILLGKDPHAGLEQANNAYISSELLEKAGADIVGKTLSWKDFPDFHVTVAGVFEAFPENTHLPEMDILIALPTIGQVMWDGRNNWLGNDRYLGYVKLHEGCTPADLSAGIRNMMKDNMPLDELRQSGTEFDLSFTPVRKIFASSSYNRIINIVFLSFAVILLAAAVLNYILLVISGMINRAKSIATCRCYGAGDSDIYRTVLGESALHGLISLALCGLLLFGLQDFLREQLGHSLQSLFPPSTLSACLLVTAAIIVVCGILPGYLYVHIPVTYAYRRYTESKRHWKLGLLFMQFLLSTCFVCLLVVIGLQYKKLTNYDTGFEYKNILYTDLAGTSYTERERCIRELGTLTGVTGVTWGEQSPWNNCSGNNVYNPETKEEYMNIADMYQVGDNYHQTFDIPILTGRPFTTGLQDTAMCEVMISRSFVERIGNKQLGWKDSPVGQSFFLTGHQGKLTVCGVYENIHLGSQLAETQDDRPTVMFYGNRPSGYLYIRLAQMDSDLWQKVQATVSQCINSQEKQVLSLGLTMGSLYNKVYRVHNSVLFAGLCILVITLTGLVAYLRDEVNRRRAETAIRIIHGASVWNVEKIFLTDLLKTALPATVIGALVSWFLSDWILKVFAVKIALGWYLFAGCILFVLVLLLSLAGLLVRRTARTNPVENLRTE